MGKSVKSPSRIFFQKRKLKKSVCRKSVKLKERRIRSKGRWLACGCLAGNHNPALWANNSAKMPMADMLGGAEVSFLSLGNC